VKEIQKNFRLWHKTGNTGIPYLRQFIRAKTENSAGVVCITGTFWFSD
jgi:hypothetical protein